MRDSLHPVRDSLHPVRDSLHPVRDSAHPVRDSAQPARALPPALLRGAALAWILALCWGLATLLTASSARAQDETDLVTGIERERLAQTGMKFLSISVDPRAAALGDAITARPGAALSMFYNVAGLAGLEHGLTAAAGKVQWIGEIDYSFASLVVRPAAGRYGVFGFSVLSADYGQIQETVRFDNEQGYLDMGQFSPSALSLGLSYARRLTDRFSAGANAKYVRQSFGAHVMRLGGGSGEAARTEQEESALAFDLGVLYATGFRSLTFALSVQNFAREVTYVEENFELPLTFRIGVGMNVLDLTGVDQRHHALSVTVDAERPRDYAEQVKVGLEYGFMEMLWLRGGYVYPADEQGLNAGVGLRQEWGGMGVSVDYAYTQFGVFGNVNRLAVQVGF